MADYIAPRGCAPGIWVFTLPMGSVYMKSVNAYLIEDTRGFTLVDSGLGNDATWELIVRGFDEIGVPIGHIDRILLTHAHPDHSGLADRLSKMAGATVWAHERDLAFINHRYVEGERFWSDMRSWLVTYGTSPEEAATLAATAETPPAQTPELVEKAQRYAHGDQLALGEYTFSVVWTPGHTPGHVCFLDEERATVLCGDHILPNVSPNIGLHPDTPLNPMPGYLSSLMEFAESSFTVTLPGHGEPLFDIQTRARQIWGHQMDRRARVLDVLAADAFTPYEIAERIWADSKPMSWADFRGHLRRNAIATLVAHLDALCDEGHVARSESTPYRYWRTAGSKAEPKLVSGTDVRPRVH